MQNFLLWDMQPMHYRLAASANGGGLNMEQNYYRDRIIEMIQHADLRKTKIIYHFVLHLM